jgi:hypothetical protein
MKGTRNSKGSVHSTEEMKTEYSDEKNILYFNI